MKYRKTLLINQFLQSRNQKSNQKQITTIEWMRKQQKQLKQPDEYEITMGTYKPHFRGKPEDYWQTTYFDFFSGIFAMVFLIGLFVGVSVLIVNWVYEYGTYSYSLSLSIATIVFVAIYFVLNFYMSKDKHKRQKQDLRRALQKFRKGSDYKSDEYKKTDKYRKESNSDSDSESQSENPQFYKNTTIQDLLDEDKKKVVFE